MRRLLGDNLAAAKGFHAWLKEEDPALFRSVGDTIGSTGFVMTVAAEDWHTADRVSDAIKSWCRRIIADRITEAKNPTG